LAAVLREEGNKAVHRLEASRVDHQATIATHSDKSRHPQTIEVKRQRVGGEPQPFSHVAGGYTLGAGLYQQPKDFQPVVLGKRGKRGDCVCRFHISTNIEILVECQAVRAAIDPAEGHPHADFLRGRTLPGV
jgi:hypothetical protein